MICIRENPASDFLWLWTWLSQWMMWMTGNMMDAGWGWCEDEENKAMSMPTKSSQWPRENRWKCHGANGFPWWIHDIDLRCFMFFLFECTELAFVWPHQLPSVPTVSDVTAKPFATTRSLGPAALFVKAKFKAFWDTSTLRWEKCTLHSEGSVGNKNCIYMGNHLGGSNHLALKSSENDACSRMTRADAQIRCKTLATGMLGEKGNKQAVTPAMTLVKIE